MFTLRVLILSLLIFSGCSTHNNTRVNSETLKPTLEQVVYNNASMTKTLKTLDNNLSVQILKTGVQGNNYVRITSLKLSDTPVIAAISQTNLKNTMFKDIIANADVTPIGVKLFAPDSKIKRRDDMQITQIKVRAITNPVIRNYLYSLSYTDNDTITQRYSEFYYKYQTMDLIEYILPSISNFTRH